MIVVNRGTVWGFNSETDDERVWVEVNLRLHPWQKLDGSFVVNANRGSEIAVRLQSAGFALTTCQIPSKAN